MDPDVVFVLVPLQRDCLGGPSSFWRSGGDVDELLSAAAPFAMLHI